MLLHFSFCIYRFPYYSLGRLSPQISGNWKTTVWGNKVIRWSYYPKKKKKLYDEVDLGSWPIKNFMHFEVVFLEQCP